MSKSLQKIYDKILRKEELKSQVSNWKKENKNIVFTNGCFDILHKGHVEYLAQAADFGDVLIVGLNSDDSVKRLGKGDERPINDELARGVVLSSLDFIDAVIVFDEDTPFELIKEIVPNTLIKGGDYDPNEHSKTSKKYIVGSDVVKSNGGNVEVINLVAGFSTTGIINKMRT